jgi:hypothetical protein
VIRLDVGGCVVLTWSGYVVVVVMRSTAVDVGPDVEERVWSRALGAMIELSVENQ